MIIEGSAVVLVAVCMLETVVMSGKQCFCRDIVTAGDCAENLLMLHNRMTPSGLNLLLIVEDNQIKQIFDGSILPGDIWIVTANYKCVFKTDGTPYIFL